MTARWLPAGLLELAREVALDIDRHRRGAGHLDADYWVELPERLVESPSRPDAPVAWGDGALCVDLGPDDVDTWETFRSVVGGDEDPESVAHRAQVWRLPVTPYREVSLGRAEVTVPSHGFVDLRGVHIVDMTSMWAGPLCTELLARFGATVVKVEPAARPDGLRFGDGDDGRGRAPMFDALNGHKEFADIDLRHCSDRGEFLQELRRADLLVTSLSPRAQQNLGLDPVSLRSQFPQLRVLSITAFAGSSAEAEWVAYGTGVHAASGLGMVEGSPQAPAFSYPDPLAGLLGCRVALAQLARAVEPAQRISLEEAIRPLVRWVA